MEKGKKLQWTCYEYDGYKKFVANIVSLDFGESGKLAINYSIEEPWTGEFKLYLECNFQMYKIGKCQTLHAAYSLANEHYKQFIPV